MKTENSSFTEKTVPLSKLFLASEAPEGFDLQVRKAPSNGIDELAALIKKDGLLHPPITRSFKGKLYVISGNRRLAALRQAFAGEDVDVKIKDADGFKGDPRELAIAANSQVEMHPVDKYESIAALIAKGMSPSDAQDLFSMSDRVYRQVMRLGAGLSPFIKEQWRNGAIDRKTAEAFTLTDDPKEQDKVFNSTLKNSYQNRVESDSVTRALTGAYQSEIGAHVAFVGIDAVKAAKILKQEDLFAVNHTVTDKKALGKLVGAKMSEVCAALVADGWGWAVPVDGIQRTWDYGTLKPAGKAAPTEGEKARLAEIKTLSASLGEDDYEQDEALEEESKAIEASITGRSFTPDQKKKAGCFLKIMANGDLSVEYGKVKPSENKAAEASNRKVPASGSKKPKPKPLKSGEAVLTQALAGRLSEQLEKAGASILKTEHAVAVSALIAGFASGGHAIAVSVSGSFDRNKKSSDFASVFEGALNSTTEAREAMLAQIAAEALSIQSSNPDKMPLIDKSIAALFGAMKGPAITKAISAEWNAKDYFAGVSTAAIANAVMEAMGADHAAKVAKMDKSSAAKFATGNVPQTGWLPLPLRTAHYAHKAMAAVGATPKATAAKKTAAPKAKKAAKKKAKK